MKESKCVGCKYFMQSRFGHVTSSSAEIVPSDWSHVQCLKSIEIFLTVKKVHQKNGVPLIYSCNQFQAKEPVQS